MYTHIHTYTLNIRACKYIKEILKDLKGESDCNTIIAGDFNNSFSTIDNSNRKLLNSLRFEPHFRPNDTYKYIENVSSKSNKIHIVFKHT